MSYSEESSIEKGFITLGPGLSTGGSGSILAPPSGSEVYKKNCTKISA